MLTVNRQAPDQLHQTEQQLQQLQQQLTTVEREIGEALDVSSVTKAFSEKSILTHQIHELQKRLPTLRQAAEVARQIEVAHALNLRWGPMAEGQRHCYADLQHQITVLLESLERWRIGHQEQLDTLLNARGLLDEQGWRQSQVRALVDCRLILRRALWHQLEAWLDTTGTAQDMARVGQGADTSPTCNHSPHWVRD